MALGRFRPLLVRAVDRLTRDAVAVTVETPDGWDWAPGQHLTFRRRFDGAELRRSYSIAAAPGEALRVGIKRVEGGAFSSWANEALRPGDRIEATAPEGRFWDGAGDPGEHVLGVAAGSGITPVLGILRHVLGGDPAARATLVYGNRRASTIMFREEIEDLKSRHLGRFSVVHVLSEGHEIPLFAGRITAEKCAALFGAWIDAGTVDRAFVCGPDGMMEAAAAALAAHGMAPGRIRSERFAGGQPGRVATGARPVARTAEAVPLRVTLDGATVALALAPGETVLEAALAAGLDAPWSCRAGVCSTCRCRVTEGEVEMAQNHAIEDDEAARGFVLSCQSRAVRGPVAVDYDVGH